MGILRDNQKKDIRYENGDFKVFEPTESQCDDILALLKEQDLKIEEDRINGEVDLTFLRYILKECTSVGAEVDEYNNEELLRLFENGNRNLRLFKNEVMNLINEKIEDMFIKQEDEMRLVIKILNILNSKSTQEEVEKKFNNLMKRNKIDLTLKGLIDNKDNPEVLKNILTPPKKARVKK